MREWRHLLRPMVRNGREPWSESRSERIVGRPTLKDLFAGTKDRQERDAAIITANRRCGYLMTEIAEHLDMDPSTVGKIARGRYNQ